jgi:hypothetical protein
MNTDFFPRVENARFEPMSKPQEYLDVFDKSCEIESWSTEKISRFKELLRRRFFSPYGNGGQLALVVAYKDPLEVKAEKRELVDLLQELGVIENLNGVTRNMPPDGITLMNPEATINNLPQMRHFQSNKVEIVVISGRKIIPLLTRLFPGQEISNLMNPELIIPGKLKRPRQRTKAPPHNGVEM